MKAFTILRFWVCALTGEVLVQFNFTISNKPVALERFFPTIDFAKTYLEKEKRGWFLGALAEFLSHKKHIIEANGNNEQSKALQICFNALNAYQTKESKNAYTLFLKGIKYFEATLPNPNNPSYQSSLLNLNEIKTFCENELKK